jgi:hypothetical protein
MGYAKACHPWTLDWLTTSLWFGLRPALRASKFAPGEFVGIPAEMTELPAFVYNDERGAWERSKND